MYNILTPTVINNKTHITNMHTWTCILWLFYTIMWDTKYAIIVYHNKYTYTNNFQLYMKQIMLSVHSWCSPEPSKKNVWNRNLKEIPLSINSYCLYVYLKTRTVRLLVCYLDTLIFMIYLECCIDHMILVGAIPCWSVGRSSLPSACDNVGQLAFQP